MKTKDEGIRCHLKSFRQAKGFSQQHLAGLVKVKRQAVYDIESGKYMPNTVLALRLAKYLDCKVEDLFSMEDSESAHPITLPEGRPQTKSRVVAARIRNRLVGYPLCGKSSLNDGFRAADGIVSPDRDTVSLFCSEDSLDNTLMLHGCDPAFSILAAHVSRFAKELRLHCRFASSHKALQGLAAGFAHLAGTHLHNKQKGEENVTLVRNLLGPTKSTVIAFSLMEEGLMVAPGNPRNIRNVADLAGGGIKLINREPGAALRTLLDDYLDRLNVSHQDIVGYADTVSGHVEGARMVGFGFADAAMGLRAVADFHGLDFVPMETVRCDLVVPNDLLHNPAVDIVLNVLQGKKFRQELSALPGYTSSLTGTVTART